jgi:hypothetical protein
VGGTRPATQPASRRETQQATGLSGRIAAIGDGMTSGLGGITHRLGSVGHGVKGLGDDMREQVEAHPMRFAGIALGAGIGAGLAAGFLARRLLD